MRLALLYNPRLLCERLAEISLSRRRRQRLRETPAAKLGLGHIDSLELLELLKADSPSVIYDIGAYYGTWTLLAKSLFPDAEVHAFEPLGQLRSRFIETTRGLSGVTYHEVAIGAISGAGTMQLASFLDASSLLQMKEAQTKEFKVNAVGTSEVKVERLDEYVQRNNMPRPDLIKLDVQGYELEALRGSEACLASAVAVICEVSFMEFYEGQCLFEDVVNFLAPRGFHILAFGAGTKVARKILQTDVLFHKAVLTQDPLRSEKMVGESLANDVPPDR